MKKGIYLSLILFSLFIGINNVKAVSSPNSLSHFDFFENELHSVNPYQSITGFLDLHRVPDNISGKSYLFVDVCSNSTFKFEVVSNERGWIYNTSKLYRTTKKCDLSDGYTGIVYRVIFVVGTYYTSFGQVTGQSQTDWELLTYAQLKSTIKVTSEAYYTSFFSLFDYGISDTPPLQDLDYENDLTQTQVLKDILETLREISINSDAGVVDAINNQTQKIEEQIKQVEDIKDMDIDASDKELPDDSKYQDYNKAESDLKDKVNQANLNYLEIGMDDHSSLFIWNTITRIIQSHPAIFAMVTSILSIGVVKLALGR